MTLQERLKELILELDRVHPNGSLDPKALGLSEGRWLPNFVTAENGLQRHFTQQAVAALNDVAGIIHDSDLSISSVLELTQFRDITRRCIADLHAEGLLDLSVHDIRHMQATVNQAVRAKLSQVPRAFTHNFPSWTLGMEAERPFVLQRESRFDGPK